MSLPWLRTDSKEKSKSPDSQKRRPRVDEFGRTLPRKSKSRSRSRSSRDTSASDRSRDSSRSKRIRLERRNFRERRGRFSRERHSRKRRSGSDSSSSSSSVSSRSSSRNRTRIVASTKPKYLNARVFVANIVSREITKEELVKQFEKYGKVIDLLVHSKNYAFIQYGKEEQALLAVEGEHGSTFKGRILDVKMANKNHKETTGGSRPSGHGRERRGRGPYGGPDRPPVGPVIPPYVDPYFDVRPRPPGPYPLPGDPYFLDPYRRGYPDPWLSDDPYRRGFYPDPYRDVYRPPPPPVIECEIFVVNSQLRAYGEAVELRVKEHNIITAVSVMPEGRTAAQLVEEVTANSCLFAIFINTQNEMHRSLTLNILHGTPQEHRNMPLDDAIALVGKSFLKYVEGLREKAQAAAVPLPSSSSSRSSLTRVFLPASPEVAYLLNLLADNRALTVSELDSVIKYLQERRDKLIDTEKRPFVTEEPILRSPPQSQGDESQSPKQDTTTKTKDPSQLTQDLTKKILSLFGSAGGKVQGVPPANTSLQQPKNPAPQASASTSTSLINFDNPNVQKALDNLLLLKKMNTNASSLSRSSDVDVSPSRAAASSSNSIMDRNLDSNHSVGRPLNNENSRSVQDNYGFLGQFMSNVGPKLQTSTMAPSRGSYDFPEEKGPRG